VVFPYLKGSTLDVHLVFGDFIVVSVPSSPDRDRLQGSMGSNLPYGYSEPEPQRWQPPTLRQMTKCGTRGGESVVHTEERQPIFGFSSKGAGGEVIAMGHAERA